LRKWALLLVRQVAENFHGLRSAEKHAGDKMTNKRGGSGDRSVAFVVKAFTLNGLENKRPHSEPGLSAAAPGFRVTPTETQTQHVFLLPNKAAGISIVPHPWINLRGKLLVGFGVSNSNVLNFPLKETA
jgi:hypothetical protein